MAEPQSSMYRLLLGRCRSLEASHVRLRAEFHELQHQKTIAETAEEEGEDAIVMLTSEYSVPHRIRGFFLSGSPYRNILDNMGHAVHVCTATGGEIQYWNRAAENLYGWKDYEALGQRVAELLIAEDYYAPLKTIMERLSIGLTWSGQFPFRKRSGEVFMAMVTKSPLYDDGDLVGIITVSRDATLFNRIEAEKKREHRGWQLNWNKSQLHSGRPPVAPVPQIASSVSNLASKLLSRNDDNGCNPSEFNKARENSTADTANANLEKAGALAAKFLAKLNIKGANKGGKQEFATSQENGKSETSICSNEVKEQSDSPRNLNPSSLYGHKNPIDLDMSSNLVSSREFKESFGLHGPSHILPSLLYANDLEPEDCNLSTSEVEEAVERQRDGQPLPSSGESTHSPSSSSSKGDTDSPSIGGCEILWEDLHLGEGIGQGSCAIVYRGMWNGSDVAIKVYFKNEYNEGILRDYRKEIDIMKRLRHPNVLLFMGAVYSQERLAIVTEYLPRGSLFRQLHKNNQALDTKRRMRMALDVARGMNYLHRRNPPIVHRDLKSSNLLVDKNWTVKVGDFGLSKFKNASFLTAKSGRGTPQWMAPEVLRNEPSNEKSDVYSFGVILWELMTVSVPWNNLNPLQVVGVVGFMDRRLEIPEGIDSEVVSIIEDCWQSDPGQRPSFEDIIHKMKELVVKGEAASVRSANP
ncbi:serine/threonine-protein kinase EDR1 isoform X2 [Argentina anserina]|uniref:serine/threonine-protein kinase EDR1 isoform X2 n=1 Tax=Argentina anserina TaxID=57926 RepID=UPI0021768E1A|nr:serine/threonine-protein kinase EDR1 isoform X2 [Potentilla anserina]